MRTATTILLAASALWNPLSVRAAETAPPPRTRTVALGPEYSTSGFHTFWFGKGYRDLWTTPVTLPVLDLQTFAGGLTPVRQVGQLQTPGLAMAGANGRSYTFRSLQKEPERSLPLEWREAWPKWIVRDHTSSTHPGAALLLPPLAEAAGVLHGDPQLVVMPDDPGLGVFRATFGGDVGTMEEFPRVTPGIPALHDATEIVSTKELWTRWLQGPENRVDSRAYLRARVLDLYVENYDRHRGQWRWARIPGHDLWEPLPEDPDMAFIRNDGLAIASVRSRAPKLVRFRESFDKRLEGSTLNGSEVDRWLLTDLDRDAFEQVVRETQSRFTDEAIAAAVARLPREWHALGHEDIAPALRARREKLVDHLMRYYRDLAKQVDVHATDRDDIVRIVRGEDDAVEVTVGIAESSDSYFRRPFHPSETDEVRIYCHGGNDRVERTGRPRGPITVRVIAGSGEDVVDDSASGGTDVWSHEGAALSVKKGKGTHAHEAWSNPEPDAGAPWLEPRNWGQWTLFTTQAAYVTELEFLFGATVTRTKWGFRSAPEARREEISALWSTGVDRGRISYLGTFRSPGSRRSFVLDVIGSGIERINFFGFGNETVRPENRDEYRTEEGFLTINPLFRWDRSRSTQIHAGPTVRISDTPADESNVLNDAEAYGRGTFAEAGVRAGVSIDSREQVEPNVLFDATPGRFADLRVGLEGFYFPPVLDVERAFGAVEGEMAAYLGRPRSRVQLAARVGARRVWGDQPWFESAFIGGRTSLRGYSRNRFAGDTSLYGGIEARAWLVSLNIPPVPLRLGALGLADLGRVWVEGEDSDEWHDTWGVGGMIQPLATPFVLTGAMAKSPEQTKLYFGSGFFF